MTAMRTMGLAPVLPSESSVDELASEYIVRLSVPGFARKELEVEIADHLVTVRGDQTEVGVDEQPFRLHERLEERFRLPRDVDTERVTATYARGALELHVPRTDGVPGGRRRVPIERRVAVNPDVSAV
jgi:HSP20 family protein